MKRLYFVTIGIVVLFFAGFLVLAQPTDPFSELTYPIPELGNCQSREACEVYCSNPENASTCLDYAERNNLIPEEEIEIARQMLALEEIAGPGGCQGHDECEAYCDDIAHLEECLIFAEAHNLIPPEELEEAKKVVAAIKRGFTPPDCRSKTECDIYCSQPENMEECITFAEAAGLIPPDELEEAKMVLEAIRKGAIPPPCQGEEECDIYCSLPEHLEECISFAEAAGFISPEEAAMIRKTGGQGPGGCRGEDECEGYCEDPAHAEECINFAVEHGFMPPEEAEQAKKMLAMGLTAGPGGCQGREECEAYCDDIAHMVECVDFAEKAGFMTPEEAARARKMAEMGIRGGPGGCQGEEECRAFCDDPANMKECLNFAVRIGEMTSEEAEEARHGMEMMQRGGPGGCKSEEECKAYCEGPAHAEECIRFSVEQGFMSPEEAQEMLERMQMMPSEGMMAPPPEEMMAPPPEGMMAPPPEGMMAPEGMMEFPGEMMKPPEGMMPPEEMMIPEGMMPSEEVIPFEEMVPPTEIMHPEETMPSPTEQVAPPQSFFDQLLQSFGLQDLEKLLADIPAFFNF
ncbi:MAG: hypothetical protein ACE5J0_00405 [Candidatus Paceibacterales bacterium]